MELTMRIKKRLSYDIKNLPQYFQLLYGGKKIFAKFLPVCFCILFLNGFLWKNGGSNPPFGI